MMLRLGWYGFAACVVITLVGCTSQRPGGDASIAPQHRQQYLLLKYADPLTGRIPENVRAMERAHAMTMPGALVNGKPQERLQDEQWISRGPWNIGGRTRAFAVDLRSTSTILAGGVSGGMWRSVDAGVNWTKTTTPDQLHSVTTIAQDPREGHRHEWYYGTGEAYGNSAEISGGGIWKSNDGGASWQMIPNSDVSAAPYNAGFPYVWRVVVHPTADTTTLFAAAIFRGILRSTDGGATWHTSLSSTSFFGDLVSTSDGTLYAAFSAFTGATSQTSTRKGIFKSVDAGLTWQDVTPSFFPEGIRRIVLGIAPSDERQVFALAESPGSGKVGRLVTRSEINREWHSLWKYRDGHGWEDRSASLPALGGITGDLYVQGGYDMICHVSPQDTNVIVIGGTNLYRSTNGFRDATATAWIGGYGKPTATDLFRAYPQHHSDQHWFAFVPDDPSKAYSANDGGVQFTENILADSVIWTSRNNGYLTSQFYAIAQTDQARDARIIGGMQDNGTWMTSVTDGTAPWTRRNGADGGFCAMLNDGRELIVSSQKGWMRRVLLDAQGNELERGRIDPIGARDYMFINPFVVDPHDAKRLYIAGGSVLWRNNDVTEIPLGADDTTSVNWDSLSSTRGPAGSVSAVSVSTQPPNIVWYGYTKGAVAKLNDAHIGMPQPIAVDAGLPKGGYVSNIHIDPRDANRVMLCFSNYNFKSVFFTDNGGTTWTDVSGNLEGPGGSGPAVNWVSIMPRDDSALYLAGTSTGLYYTAQLNGASTVWSQASADIIGVVPVHMVLSRASDGGIAVATHGNGVFSGSIDRVPDAPVSPQLQEPTDGTCCRIASELVLRWRPVQDAPSYRVEISRSSTFDTLDLVIDPVQDTVVSVKSLMDGRTRYHWRVYAYGPGGKGAASEQWAFTTSVAVPELVDPGPSAKDVPGLPVRLAWNRVEGATAYHYQVSVTVTFNTLVTEGDSPDTVAFVKDLASQKRYYWRARAAEDGGSGQYSSPRSFTTGVLTSVVDDASNVIDIAPNPASDRIDVTVPIGVGSIEIVDAAGRLVMQRVVTSATTRIDVKHLTAGAYIVRYTHNGNVHTMPLIITR